ncbi:MAG TPA: protein translocase subunit SecF [Candidatus Nanoarchaeia archaeon]|nr:protein translocase subunit SecF [Candidatus Nanoarchaeia archaeon]
MSDKRNLLIEFYDKHYKPLTILPIIFLVVCLGIIAFNYFSTGEIIQRDITLKGGVTIIVTPTSEVDLDQLEGALRLKHPDLEIELRKLGGTGFIVESDTVDSARIDNIIKDVSSELGGLDPEQYSVQVVGSSLGQSFYREAIFAMLLAFVFMAIVVLAYFRNFVPSMLVIFAAFADIVMPFAMMIIFNIKLSTAGIAAFLMLIGYSVDTDILLTSRLRKFFKTGKANADDGTILDNILGAMRTGMLMTSTAIVVVLIAYFFSDAETLKQIMLILAIGLAFDIVNTWLTNAGMLRWYLEHKAKKNE